MAPKALAELSREHEDFYVPTFTIRVGERDVVRELFLAVSGVQLDLKERAPGQFSFTVANAFDLERREFVAMQGEQPVDLFELFSFGSPVRVRIGYGAGPALELSGLVTELSTSFSSGGTPELTIKGFDALYPLTIGKSTRNWEGKRDSDAVTDVARDRGLAVNTERTEPVRPRIDQSQQTDMAFIETLAQRNQATYYVRDDELYFGRRHNQDGAVVQLAWGFGLVSFAPEANLARQITEVQVHARSATEGKEIVGRARKGDETGRDTRASSGSERVVRALSSSPILSVRAPVHTQAEADERAKAILDERAQDFVTGGGECIGLPEIVPDVNIELGGMGRGLQQDVLGVRGNPQARRRRLHHDVQGAGDDGLMDSLLGPTDETEREADGYLTGVMAGVVTDNRDPEGLARVRVRLPWYGEGATSFWARLAVPMAGDGRGTYFLPEVDDEVLVIAEAGDPSHLYVIGSLWNGKAPPPVTNDDGKNNERLIHSRSGHRLRFVDDDAAPEIDLELKDGAHVRLDKDGVVVDAGNGNSVSIASSGTIEIKAAQKLELKAPSIAISADASLEVKASGTLTLKGAAVQIN